MNDTMTMNREELTAQIIETFESLDDENRACFQIVMYLIKALDKGRADPEPLEQRLLNLTLSINQKLDAAAEDPNRSQDERSNAKRGAYLYKRTHDILKKITKRE